MTHYKTKSINNWHFFCTNLISFTMFDIKFKYLNIINRSQLQKKIIIIEFYLQKNIFVVSFPIDLFCPYRSLVGMDYAIHVQKLCS